jgi:short-subunit dehydrogenase
MNQSVERTDKVKFGPWAIVTGASSGIGEEFARQLAANRISLVLVARRLALLNELGARLTEADGIQCRSIPLDLSQENFIDRIHDETKNLDIGLLVSNAGAGQPGRFLDQNVDDLRSILRLNSLSHLSLTHYFGNRFARRGRGGVLLVSAMGAVNGIPFMANAAATKSYMHSLGRGLHREFLDSGVHLTVLLPGLIDTPVLEKLGLTKEALPMKPLSVEQCVREGLHALGANEMEVIPGRLNRVMNRVIPAWVMRRMNGDRLKSGNGL